MRNLIFISLYFSSLFLWLIVFTAKGYQYVIAAGFDLIIPYLIWIMKKDEKGANINEQDTSKESNSSL